jgi:putative colanic acid biosysnthesis UDP-glucose lipid carrier transferase
LLLSPLMLCIGAAIKLTSSGPVVFRQRRHGLHGQEIVVYKFRTMRVVEEGTPANQAQRGDPRITPLGQFLRRTSLDELPQFINVLQGRMSVVGPRPHAVAENEHFARLLPGYARRHDVLPGITGWAQVNGQRGSVETVAAMARRLHFDLEYVERQSLWLDLRIILRTVGLVVMDRSAY